MIFLINETLIKPALAPSGPNSTDILSNEPCNRFWLLNISIAMMSSTTPTTVDGDKVGRRA